MSQYHWRLPRSPCSCLLLLLLLLLLSDCCLSVSTELPTAPTAPAAPAAPPSLLTQANCSSSCGRSDATPTEDSASRGQDAQSVWGLNGSEAITNHTLSPVQRSNSTDTEIGKHVEPTVHTSVPPQASPPSPSHPFSLNTSNTPAPGLLTASPAQELSKHPPPAEAFTEPMAPPTSPPTALKTPPSNFGSRSSHPSTLATTSGPKGSSGSPFQISPSAAPTREVPHPSSPSASPGATGSPTASQTVHSSPHPVHTVPAPPTLTLGTGTRVSMVEAAGVALSRQLVDRASLLAVLLFGLLFFLVTVAVFLTQAYESYRRRDYTQVDYLINGMYSDSGV